MASNSRSTESLESLGGNAGPQTRRVSPGNRGNVYAYDRFAPGLGPEERLSTAIIDAATGEPTRTGSHRRSRYVTPIANVPLICHVFDELAHAGVRHARIVASQALCLELERTLGGEHSSGVEVSYVTAPDSDGGRAVLGAIDGALSAGPVLVCPGDCLFPGQIAAMRDRFAAGDVDLVLLASAGKDLLSDPPSDAPAAGRACETAAILGPATRDVLAELLSSGLDGPDLLESLVAGGGRVAVCEMTDHWCYSDSTEALLAGNRVVLESLVVPPDGPDLSDDNRIHGRVAISAGARISNSTIRGPVAIDERAVVEDSFIGPYTSIGFGAIVSGAEIDNTIVHAMAEIRHPGHRIEASIIGERALIDRSFGLPKGLHLRLEPGSSVTFS
jgi:glucose-1-phosphate thymidylyltransferase